MIKELTLNLPSTVEFGAGKLTTLMNHLNGIKRVFFLIDAPVKDKVLPVIEELERQGIQILISTDVVPEPPIYALENLFAPVKEFAPECVVGIGGGSAIDLAKLVAVLFDGKQSVADVIGIGNVACRNVKLIAVSTTSGTGSEVTPIAVLTDTEMKLKKGVVSRYLVPDVAIIDPLLTLSLPAAVTAATGMDALTHCLEAYTNRNAHPIVDNLALEGIRLIAFNMEKCVTDGTDIEARTALALGSFYGGLCLGPVNTAAVHALAYPLGGEFKISHGVSNSVLLPFVMQFNLSKCIEKYAVVAKILGVEKESQENSAKAAIHRIREISDKCGIPGSLKDLGLKESDVETLSQGAIKVTRLLQNNPREITIDDARFIFSNAYKGIIER